MEVFSPWPTFHSGWAHSGKGPATDKMPTTALHMCTLDMCTLVRFWGSSALPESRNDSKGAAGPATAFSCVTWCFSREFSDSCIFTCTCRHAGSTGCGQEWSLPAIPEPSVGFKWRWKRELSPLFRDILAVIEGKEPSLQCPCHPLDLTTKCEGA